MNVVKWPAANVRCGRNFNYTPIHAICQEKKLKKIIYLFFPKHLTFSYDVVYLKYPSPRRFKKGCFLYDVFSVSHVWRFRSLGLLVF